MLKETVVAVSIVTMAAGAALAPSAVSASGQPLVVADSHEACNPCACNPCACNPCADEDPCAACNPCDANAQGEPLVVAECNPCAEEDPCAACNPCADEDPCAACNPCASS